MNSNTMGTPNLQHPYRNARVAMMNIPNIMCILYHKNWQMSTYLPGLLDL